MRTIRPPETKQATTLQVALRCRPLTVAEKSRYKELIRIENNKVVVVSDADGSRHREKRFSFDYALGPEVKNQQSKLFVLSQAYFKPLYRQTPCTEKAVFCCKEVRASVFNVEWFSECCNKMLLILPLSSKICCFLESMALTVPLESTAVSGSFGSAQFDCWFLAAEKF
ncbi:hypothetical protein L7F22_037406 [Adiantum nelumboides]|nr:hypothetical protein [Adiantum nelumboides]